MTLSHEGETQNGLSLLYPFLLSGVLLFRLLHTHRTHIFKILITNNICERDLNKVLKLYFIYIFSKHRYPQIDVHAWPFRDGQKLKIDSVKPMMLDEFVQYVDTWSGVKTYKQKHPGE